MNPLWPHGDPREVAHRILSDPRFGRAPQRPGEKTWLELLAAAVNDVWKRLTEPLNHLTGSTRLTTILGIVVLVAVLVLLALVAAHFARRVSWRRPAARAAAGATGFDDDAATLLARARAAAAAGRHREAAALLWASALRALDERGRVRYDPARTPGEWRRLVHDAHFDAFARDAVLALFADRGPDAALVARMREAYDRIVTPA